MPRYADVVVPRHLHRLFTYSVPPALQRSLVVGDSVLVPFGSVTLRGLVVSVADRVPDGTPGMTGAPPTRLRAIVSRVSSEAASQADGAGSVESRMLELVQWLAAYYVAPLGACLQFILPPAGAPPQSERYAVTEDGRQALATDPALGNGAERSEWTWLHGLAKRAKGASLAWLRKQKPSFSSARLTMAVERGWVIVGRTKAATAASSTSETTAPPSPQNFADGAPQLDTNLTERVAALVQQTDGARRLLIEGDTETRLDVLCEACALALARSQTVIVIAPEVRRVDAIASALETRWGAALVERWGGARTAAQRRRAWDRVRAGTVRIVVGTRTAVFAPLANVGLLCVDDADQAVLKSEQAPHFHARDVAWRRAECEGAALLLLSHRASLETRHRLQGEREMIAVQTSDSSRAAAPVDIVPLAYPPREEALSPPLCEAIEQALSNRQRIVLYLNRRGYAPALICVGCGAIPRCPGCRVALSFSRTTRRLRCRACGTQQAAPERCQACDGLQFDMIGYGTERLEAEVSVRFPQARRRRIDRDVAAAARAAQNDTVVTESDQPTSDDDWDIAIGTSLLTRELPSRSCHLVGIVYAEAGLHVPDFRASERTYQELSAIVALADPAVGGRALVQTCLPNHAVMQALATGDRTCLDREEQALRQALAYPPYGALISLHVVGTQAARVQDIAERWAKLLRAILPAAAARAPLGQGMTVMGPVAAPVVRGANEVRARLLLKGPDGEALRLLVARSLTTLDEAASRARVKLSVDVDPVSVD
ncbi:MAG: primosomal protein N' [Nitrospiraceae bacterium]